MNLQDEKEFFRMGHELGKLASRVAELEKRVEELQTKSLSDNLRRMLKTFLLQEGWIDAEEYHS